MSRTRYHEALAERRAPVGLFCCLDGYSVAHIFAAAGFDFMIFDRQHAAYTWPELEQICFRVRSAGASAFIRTGSTEEAEINLALDLPIDGIVLPNLTSAADVRRALAFAKYPPKGVRSLGNERHDTIWGAYSAPDPLVGMLVEHPGAVAEIEAILELEIDFTWVGAHDLSALMGLDPHKALAPEGPPPELAHAIARVRDASKRAGVPFWGPPPDSDAFIGGVDARLVMSAAQQALAAVRGR
jgi:2-keto-3-deoxy-L-rhamnonate aldolase RhmA